MVTSAIRAVAERLAPKSAETVPTRRLLLVVRLVDGDWVLQKAQDDHKSRQRYKAEAKSLFRSLFPREEEEFCAKDKADKAMLEVLGFRRTNDLEAGAHFERDGIEWHPVILRLDYFGLQSSYLTKKANLEGRVLTVMAEHPHREKLLKCFPR